MRSRIEVPVVPLDRIDLEPLSYAHSHGMFALWSDPAVCEHSGPAIDSIGRPIQLPAASRSESDRLVQYWLDRANAGTGLRWAVVLRATCEFVGAVGYNSLGQVPEYAYHFGSRWWGVGLAAEASRGALAWAFERGATGIELFTEPDNRRSLLLARRLGFERSDEPIAAAHRLVLARASTA